MQSPVSDPALAGGCEQGELARKCAGENLGEGCSGQGAGTGKGLNKRWLNESVWRQALLWLRKRIKHGSCSLVNISEFWEQQMGTEKWGEVQRELRGLRLEGREVFRCLVSSILCTNPPSRKGSCRSLDGHRAPPNTHSRGKNCYVENPEKSGFKAECDISVNIFSRRKADFHVKSVFFLSFFLLFPGASSVWLIWC